MKNTSGTRQGQGNSTYVQILQALGGGVSGACTRFVTHPFDVLKIRFQLQVEPLSGSHNSKYRGMMQAFSSIYREEGLRGIWKGHVAGQVMSVTYALVQFWSYEQLRRAASDTEFFHERPHLKYFLCGGMAGCLGTIAAQPFDVVRTRVVAADPNTRTGKLGAITGVSKVFRTEGWRGVSSGLMMTLLQIYPLVGANFAIYKFCNEMTVKVGEHITKEPNPRHNIPGVLLFINGAIAGVLSKMLVYPADLIKKRHMLSHFKSDRKTFGKNPKCDTLSHCFKNTLKNEGLAGFYKGMVPTLYKSGVMSAFYFTIYDSFNRYVTQPYNRYEQSRQAEKQKKKAEKGAPPKKTEW